LDFLNLVLKNKATYDCRLSLPEAEGKESNILLRQNTKPGISHVTNTKLHFKKEEIRYGWVKKRESEISRKKKYSLRIFPWHQFALY
jgi:hypothetical protein